MKKIVALFIITSLSACGDNSTPPRVNDPSENPFMYLEPCTMVNDDAGNTRTVDGGFEVALSSIMYGGGERTWASFSFSIRALSGPNCRAIELRELPFHISGNKNARPSFESWTLHNRTHERQGVLSQGTIDHSLIVIKPNLLLHPGDEVELTLAINCDDAQMGQRFRLTFEGPIIWRIWNDHEEHVKVLDPSLEAIYVF